MWQIIVEKKFTEVSEECTASIFKVSPILKVEKALSTETFVNY
jgi:hypothetical protein